MIAKCKILLHHWQTNSALLVSFGDVCLTRSRIEIQINASANLTPGDITWAEENFLAMSITVIYPVRKGNVFAGGLCLGGRQQRQIAG